MAKPFAFPAEAYGVFAGLGGSVVTIEWVPDPAVIRAALVRVEGYLDNVEPPLRTSMAICIQDMHNKFEREGGAEGPWAPLDPDYLNKKLSMGGPASILTWTGALHAAAASPSAYQITGDSLFYDTSGLPEYGMYHEEGTGGGGGGNVGRRALVQTRREERGFTGKSHEYMGIGRGQALPRREFISITAEAEEQIFDAFDLWFAAVEGIWQGGGVYVGPSGMMQSRGAGGRFGPRVFPI